MTKILDDKLRLILFLLAFLLYANTITHDYVWDDSIVITDNGRVKKGILGIPDLFLKYNSDYKSDKYGYRPLVLSSFAIDYTVSKNNPTVSHFMNVLYFSLLCCVLFMVLKKIFYRYTNLVAFLVTLLFIVHPIHVEVVANIKSRDEIFALLFSLLALSKLIDFQKTGRLKYIVYAILLFLSGYLSKESAIVFLAIFPLTLLYMQDSVNYKKLLKPIFFSLILLIVSLVIFKLYTSSSLGVQSSKGAGIYYESGILGNCFFYIDVFGTKLANAFALLLIYLKNFFWPVNLIYFYGYNQIPVANWQQPLVILSAVVHLALLLFALLKIRKQKEISYGILFYFISISIYLQVFRTIADTMADRFMFVPSVGLIVVIVFALGKVFKIDYTAVDAKNVFNLSKERNTVRNFRYFVVLVTLLCSGLTLARNKVWKNNETLVTHDLPYMENCSRAHSYYADMLKSKLSSSYNEQIEREMIDHYKKSYTISKEAYYAYLGLGTYLCNVKRYEEGIAVLDSMLGIYPNEADPNFYLGQTYYSIQNYANALVYLQKSLDLAPEVSNTYHFLALTHSKLGNYEKAISVINLSKQKFGETLYTYEALGNVYFDKGDIDESAKYTFEMLKYGANPETVYGIVIGRYQAKKMDAQAAFYYKQGLERGVFKRN